jgi:hypothetical protein
MMSLEITDLCREASLGLTYDTIKDAITNCHKRQQRERLRHEVQPSIYIYIYIGLVSGPPGT